MADYTAFFSHHLVGDKACISCLIKEGSYIRYTYNEIDKCLFYNGDIYFKYLAFKTIIEKFTLINLESPPLTNTYRICLNDEEIISCLQGYNSRKYKKLVLDMSNLAREFSLIADFSIIDTRELEEIASIEFVDFLLFKKSKISNRDIIDGLWRVDQSAKAFETAALNYWIEIENSNIINQNLDNGV